MALRPDILLQGRVPDISNAIPNALLTFQQVQAGKARREQAPIRNRLLEAQVGAAEQAAEQARQTNRISSIAAGALELLPAIKTGNVEAVRNKLLQRKSELEGQGIPTNDTDEALAMLDVPGGLLELQRVTESAVDMGRQFGVVGRSPTGTASGRDFEQFQALSRRAESTGDPVDIKAAEQFGRQSGFSRETAQELADIGVQKAGDIARSRAGVQLDTEPAIEAAVTEAVGEAKAKTPLGAQELESKRQQQVITRQKSVLANAELKLKRTEAVAQADDTIALIDKLIAHPGRKAATGTTAIFPTTPGSRAADFEADFNRLKGSAFLEAVQKLKGSGQISNTEGEAATASVLGIEIGQSEEGFVESLKSLRARINEAKKRRSGTFAEAESQDLTQSSDDDLLSF